MNFSPEHLSALNKAERLSALRNERRSAEEVSTLRNSKLDIVKRLTAVDDSKHPGDLVAILCAEAADVIENLRWLLAEALACKSPDFAKRHPQWAESVRDAIESKSDWED